MTNSEEKPLVFVVDDDPEICHALSLLLHQENMEVKQFTAAEDFLAFFTNTGIREYQSVKKCVILDVLLPGMNGMQLQEILNEKEILLPVIFLTGHGNIPMSVDAMKAGAENFLTKPVSREKLMENVHSALLKDADWVHRLQEREAARQRLCHLTGRELEILALAIDGYPNKLIARRLEISLRTVEHHKSSILNKTNTANVFELARLVKDSGMIFV